MLPNPVQSLKTKMFLHRCESLGTHIGATFLFLNNSTLFKREVLSSKDSRQWRSYRLRTHVSGGPIVVPPYGSVLEEVVQEWHLRSGTVSMHCKCIYLFIIIILFCIFYIYHFHIVVFSIEENRGPSLFILLEG